MEAHRSSFLKTAGERNLKCSSSDWALASLFTCDFLVLSALCIEQQIAATACPGEMTFLERGAGWKSSFLLGENLSLFVLGFQGLAWGSRIGTLVLRGALEAPASH